jgi:hypothetical protein
MMTDKRPFVSIYLTLCLLQAGCATSSPVRTAPSSEVRKGFGTIAVATGEVTPKVKFRPPEHMKGTAGAAARTSAGAVGVMWGGCLGVAVATAPTIVLPAIILAGCVVGTPFVAVGGALMGGGNSAAAKANRAARAAREPEVKALRGVVNPALSALATEKPLHARLLDRMAARTQGTVVSVTKSGRWHYTELLRNGIDTVLEADVVRIDVSTENAFVLTARVRLIRLADRQELYANTPTFTIASRSVSEWTADGGGALRAALVSGYQALADEIVEDLVGTEHGSALASQSQQDADEPKEAGTTRQTATSANSISAVSTP